jgi:peptidyl-prolyl cis-trans isomerase B (cyclophilin B)
MTAFLRLTLSLLMALFLAANANAAEKPKVLFKTNKGDITIELFPDKAPKTVANFLQYVRGGHYNGTIFHRVIASFVAQGGGFTKDYQRLPTKAPVAIEADNGLSNERGTIAMARTSDPKSATDQFFFNLKFNGFLNHRSKTRQGWGYTVFGRVVDGMNIVGRIARVKTGAGGPFGQDVPAEPIILEAANVVGE